MNIEPFLSRSSNAERASFAASLVQTPLDNWPQESVSDLTCCTLVLRIHAEVLSRTEKNGSRNAMIRFLTCRQLNDNN